MDNRPDNENKIEYYGEDDSKFDHALASFYRNKLFQDEGRKVGKILIVNMVFTLIFSIIAMTSLSGKKTGDLTTLAIIMATCAIYYICFNFFRKNNDYNISWKKSANKTKIAIFGLSIEVLLNFLFSYLLIIIIKLIMDIKGISVGADSISQLDKSLDLLGGNIFIDILSIAILPGIFEELFYRGIVYAYLRKTNVRTAMVLSALIFSLAHENIFQSFPIFFMGIIFALAYEITGDIRVPIFIHIANNSLSILATYMSEFQSATMLIILGLGLLLAMIYTYKNRNSLKEILGDKEKGSLLATISSKPMTVYLIISAMGVMGSLIIAVEALSKFK